MPLSDVALPPAGIRFIWLGGSDVIDGAGVFAPGAEVDEAGCARTGAEITNTATTAALIKRCFMSNLS
jgi:hypothetical protein